MSITDPLRAAIVAEIERQAKASGAYYVEPRSEPPFGWDDAEDGPWREFLAFDGKLDMAALCAAVRSAVDAAAAEEAARRVATTPADERPGGVYPAEVFSRAGVSLYGDQFVAPLAAALAVEKNTVRKMANGASRIPPGVWRDVFRLIIERVTVDLPTVGNEIRKLHDEQGRPIIGGPFAGGTNLPK